MMQWVEEIQSSPSTRYSDASFEFPSSQFKDDLPRIARQYALSLFPTVLPARGDLIETLIEEDVGKYVNFRLVDGVAIFQTTRDDSSNPNGTWKKVPAGKDQIFKDSSLSLLEKRRLMKFIMFASSEKGFALGAEDVDPLLRGEPGVRSYHIAELRRTLAPQAKNRNRSSIT
jgi:RAB protein geranylgeranyltransferase component A